MFSIYKCSKINLDSSNNKHEADRFSQNGAWHLKVSKSIFIILIKNPTVYPDTIILFNKYNQHNSHGINILMKYSTLVLQREKNSPHKFPSPQKV